MPSRAPAKAQLPLALDAPRASPLLALPESAVAALAELRLEAAGCAAQVAEGSGDEQQDRR